MVECDVEQPTITRASVTSPTSSSIQHLLSIIHSFIPRIFVQSVLLPEEVVDPKVQMTVLNTCEICHCFFPL